MIENCSTKQKGDIAEQAAILRAMKMGWGVSKVLGDRLPYDLIFDVNGVLRKIQVKSAWFDESSQNYKLDTRRTKTNRREMKRSYYKPGDFDFALAFIEDLDLFYVIPFDVFVSYKSDIHLVVALDRQREVRINAFRDAWNLMIARAPSEETLEGLPVKVGEVCNVITPSQAQ